MNKIICFGYDVLRQRLTRHEKLRTDKKSELLHLVGSGALAQGSTHFTSFSDFRKDQNA